MRNIFGEFLERARNAIANLFGGHEEAPSPPPTPSEAPIDHEAEIEDTDDDLEDPDEADYSQEDELERDFARYTEAIDEADYYEAVYQEIRIFEDTLIEPEYLRVVRYASGQEAQDFLDEAGLSAFAEILYVESEDLFTIAVYDSPGVAA